jgi:hypothetical protein
LAIVSCTAGLCSIGVCIGWPASVGIFILTVIGGGFGISLTRTQRGFLRGALTGYLVSLLSLLIFTGHILYIGYIHENDEKPEPYLPAEICPAEEMLKAVQTLFKSERNALKELKTEAFLPGHYAHSMDLLGEDLYLFPDKTYFYLEWADIIPMSIRDKGTWTIEKNLVVLHPNDDIPDSRGPMERVFLPMCLPAEKTTTPPDTDRERVLLPCTVDVRKEFLDPISKSKNISFLLITIYSYAKEETISRERIDAVKEDLYTHYPSSFDRALWRKKLQEHGLAVILMIAMGAMFISLRRRRTAE